MAVPARDGTACGGGNMPCSASWRSQSVRPRPTRNMTASDPRRSVKTGLPWKSLRTTGSLLGSEHEEETIVLVEWEREGVGDGGIADLVVDVDVEVGLGLQLRQFLDLASLLDEQSAVSEDVGQSSGDLILNLVESGNDGVIVSLHAFGGFFSVGLDMREPLDGVIQLHPQGSLEAVGGRGAEGFEGTDVLSAESINSDGANLVESS